MNWQRKTMIVTGVIAVGIAFGLINGCAPTETPSTAGGSAVQSGPVGTSAVCYADLAVTSVKVPASATHGTSITITDITANVDATCTAAVSTTTGMWLSRTSNGVSVCTFTTHTVPMLPPGSNWVWTGARTVCGTLSAGGYWFVDVANKLLNTSVEANFANNTNSVQITIK